MKKLIILTLLACVINTYAENSSADDKSPLYTENLFQHENIFIGPQPQLADFETLKSAGFTKVINMRKPDEMEKLNFYEDYMLKKAEIDYHLIPIGGDDNNYSPSKLEEFAQALESSQGKVLLHCGSGYRASQLWAAYQVKYKGKTPDEALEMVKDMGWWPMPMEALLGKKLKVSIAVE